MTEIWMVSMGIGEMVQNKSPIRVFSTKEGAYKWVEDCFKEQIKRLKEDQTFTIALNIGNSFSIQRKEIDK